MASTLAIHSQVQAQEALLGWRKAASPAAIRLVCGVDLQGPLIAHKHALQMLASARVRQAPAKRGYNQVAPTAAASLLARKYLIDARKHVD